LGKLHLHAIMIDIDGLKGWFTLLLCLGAMGGGETKANDAKGAYFHELGAALRWVPLISFGARPVEKLLGRHITNY